MLKPARQRVILAFAGIAAMAQVSCAQPEASLVWTQDLKAWIDERVEEKRLEYKVPSISLVVISGDRRVLSKAYGVKDVRTGEPATTDTVYQIASITKTFVGALAAKLTVEGVVDLDAPITRYAPDLVFHETARSSPVTLRLLLSHQSGLPTDPVNRRNVTVPGLPENFDPTIAAPYTKADLLEGLAATPSRYDVGERYHYSNFGMHLAGYVLAKAAGAENFAQALDRHVLQPLDMGDTFIRTSPARDAQMATPYAYTDDEYYKVFPIGTRAYFEIPAWTFGDITGGVGLSSTAVDLSKYIMELMNADAASSPFRREMVDLMLRTNAEFVMKDELVYEIGLAWRKMAFGRYGAVYSHGGHNDGHHGFVLFSRDRKLAVIELTNGAHTANRSLATEIMLKLMQSSGGEG